MENKTEDLVNELIQKYKLKQSEYDKKRYLKRKEHLLARYSGAFHNRRLSFTLSV